MSTEGEKYRSEVLKIIGLAMLAPLGNLLINPANCLQEHNIANSIYYICSSLISSYIGILFISRSDDIVETETIKRWKQ